MTEKHFTLKGRRYRLTRSEVEAGLDGVDPEIIWDLAVFVNGQWFPVKQAFVTPLGLSNRDTNSRFAWRILRAIGLPVHDKKTDGPLPDKPGARVMAETETRRTALTLAAEVNRGSGVPATAVIEMAEAFEVWLGAA